MGIRERKERGKRDVRKRILETAMKLFLEEGFEKVTIRRIAEAIEYSPAAIYLHFKDKDEILYALHSEGFDALYEQQMAILSIKDPLKRLRRHGEIYLTFALDKPEYYDLMFIMKNPAKKIKEQKAWDVGLRSYEFLRNNVQDCIEAGVLPMADVDVATFSLWAHVHGIASLIIRGRCIMFPEDHLKAIAKGAIDFMMRKLLNTQKP
jgi:AcrR family transcriptional regulator